MEYFSCIKKNQVVVPDTARMKLKNVMRSKNVRNQSHTCYIVLFHIFEMSGIGK